MHDEVGPEAVFLSGIAPPEKPLDEPDLWHLIDAVRVLTWCGMDIGYGASRKLWSETPQDRRCQMCLRRLVRAL